MTQVKVSEGTLEGEILESSLGFKYYCFKGIPYAAPPLGNLRFQAPQPLKLWAGVRSAKEHGPICPQYKLGDENTILESEDCLYLNVYTNNIKPKKSFPVMFWIHGGGFKVGSGNSTEYGPDFLIHKDIILVTINYRLEVLGVLNLDLEEASGNMGMKDQVAALRWVQKNISNFGGDPDNITIFGESAGAASVSFHLVSPMSETLFKRAIMQSGTCLHHWANANLLKERAFALGRHLGIITKDPKELLDFLKSQPVENLINSNPKIIIGENLCSSSFEVYWAVSKEKYFDNVERFFYESCYDAVRQGIHKEVDVMLGYNKDEGVMVLGSLKSIDETIEIANIHLEYFTPYSITWNCSALHRIKVGKIMKNYYFQKETITRDDISNFAKRESMNMFVFHTLQWEKITASKHQVIYLYKFNCYSERNQTNIFRLFNNGLKLEETIQHADDLVYIFFTKNAQVPAKGSKVYKMINNATTLWTNFAKYGNPTPNNSLGVKWSPFTIQEQEYLDINEELVSKSFPEKEETEFWENIFKKYLPSHSIGQSIL